MKNKIQKSWEKHLNKIQSAFNMKSPKIIFKYNDHHQAFYDIFLVVLKIWIDSFEQEQ